MSTYNATNFLIYLNKYLPVLHDIGGGGKRKPPPMHQMRRLREPGKIHQRRRNCSARAVTLLLRLSGEVSQASIRRVPWPQWRSRGTRDPTAAREICFAAASRGHPPSAKAETLYHKFRSADGDLAKTSGRRPVRALSAGICLMA